MCLTLSLTRSHPRCCLPDFKFVTEMFLNVVGSGQYGKIESIIQDPYLSSLFFKNFSFLLFFLLLCSTILYSFEKLKSICTTSVCRARHKTQRLLLSIIEGEEKRARSVPSRCDFQPNCKDPRIKLGKGSSHCQITA